QEEGGGHEDRGIGANDDAEQHREREAVDDRGAEDVEGEHRQRRRDGRQHRARQGLVDREVQELDERHALIAAEVLADAIKHHHGVVDGVTGQGEDGGHHGQIELIPEQREHADSDENVVRERQDGGNGELPLEAEPHVKQDAEHGGDDGDYTG